ncbi:MAG: AAA family ATPase [Candidatus Aenigmarchaeota archaeon]|nr:AAA family ATPase [Candidatus Aenigmarchaeota archaeon]
MRVPTGIPGLDELIEGGFEEGNITLVTGGTGTGKSTLCMQFIYNGITQYNEKGVYITTEENVLNIKRQSAKFNWNIEELEKDGSLRLIEMEPFDIDTISDRLSEVVEKMDAKRIVIDSVSMFEMYIHDPFKIRKTLFKILQRIREMNRVCIVTAEIPEDSKGLSREGVIEFMVDGVILLKYLGIAKYKRSLAIRKMRMTDHSSDIHPFEITQQGIEVYSV